MNDLLKTYGAIAALGLGAAAAVGIVGYVLVKKYGDKLNPASQNNVANQLVSGAVQSLTGGAAQGGEDSIGGIAARFREWVSGDDAKIRALLTGAPVKPAAPSQPASGDLATGTYYGY